MYEGGQSTPQHHQTHHTWYVSVSADIPCIPATHYHPHLFCNTTVERVLPEERTALKLVPDTLAFHILAVRVVLAVGEQTVVSNPAEVSIL